MLTNEQQMLVIGNMAFVNYIIGKQFSAVPLCNTISRDDLESAGYLGLCKAAKTFDPALETKFSTYAAVCIANEIRMILRKHRVADTISLSECVGDYFDTPEKNSLGALIGQEEEGFENILDKIFVEQIVPKVHKAITPKERQILKYHLLGYKQEYIGEQVGTSQPFISRKINKIKSVLNRLCKIE